MISSHRHPWSIKHDTNTLKTERWHVAVVMWAPWQFPLSRYTWLSGMFQCPTRPLTSTHSTPWNNIHTNNIHPARNSKFSPLQLEFRLKLRQGRGTASGLTPQMDLWCQSNGYLSHWAIRMALLRTIKSSMVSASWAIYNDKPVIHPKTKSYCIFWLLFETVSAGDVQVRHSV